MKFCDSKICQPGPTRQIEMFDCTGNTIISLQANFTSGQTPAPYTIGPVPFVSIDPVLVPECSNLREIPLP